MTAIVTWNIQNGKGCDGATDLARVAGVIRALGEADVICLQEVARHDPAFGAGADQAAQLEALFPGFGSVFGPALVRGNPSASPRQYGNLILCRLALLQVFNHLLPQPAEGGVKHMQRQAIEAVLATKGGPLRVMTTHLEYHSARHRAAQVERLRALQDEAAANVSAPAKLAPSPYDPVPRPASLVICGDFNFLPDDAEYASLFRAPLLDAWRFSKKGAPHPPSTGLHDHRQWPMGGHCRDYFAVSVDVAARIESIEMDSRTDASDHQPLRLVLSD
ncbi:MAG TPA: endonuclease/exonuclease/phosphatase family protein [Burkholderiales bacterium]|nr:endonuclease/exonuclease/phosphatase family protein [Burkholderiales bacterium]